MHETYKTTQVLNEMEKNQLDILRIIECRLKGAGKQGTSSATNTALLIISKDWLKPT